MLTALGDQGLTQTTSSSDHQSRRPGLGKSEGTWEPQGLKMQIRDRVVAHSHGIDLQRIGSAPRAAWFFISSRFSSNQGPQHHCAQSAARNSRLRRAGRVSLSKPPTIAEHLKACGVSRRSFLQLCATLMATAPLGLAFTGNKSILQIANAIKAKRPSVIGLRFQNCTGCTEALLRTSAPGVAPLILDVISLDYHEPLMAASGAQAEAALRSAMAENAGSYVLGVEGAIPTRDDSVYMQMGRQGCGSGGEESGRPPFERGRQKSCTGRLLSARPSRCEVVDLRQACPRHGSFPAGFSS